mgnify:CR=1 FL=1
MNFDCTKYKRANFQPKNFKDRQWPDKEITKAPIWCSVDLRDGNQSLPTPMNVDEKIKMFNMLLEVGFKEIEIGFPSASQTEYDFLRKLIDEDLIPDDVTIQVLTQSREHLIVKTFESLKGCKKAIVHLYNSTSILQREVVFHKSKDEIMDIAVKGAEIFNREAKKYPQTKFQYEYSPESFTGTEMDYALEICEAVMDVWKPTSDNKMIINLPSTVEMTTPNLYADQIEWFSRKIKHRDCVTISLHPHNDRGTSVAACELGILAGADRIEGTLFGNGERTGNLDIITVAMNMYSSGIDPKLDFSNILKITDIYKKVLVTPGIYDYFIKNLDINGIKSFNKSFKEIEFKASRTAIASIIETEGILTEDEAFAMLSCMANRMDALIDDPRKAKIFALHRINVIRPGDLATAAVITKNIRKRR